MFAVPLLPFDSHSADGLKIPTMTARDQALLCMQGLREKFKGKRHLVAYKNHPQNPKICLIDIDTALCVNLSSTGVEIDKNVYYFNMQSKYEFLSQQEADFLFDYNEWVDSNNRYQLLYTADKRRNMLYVGFPFPDMDFYDKPTSKIAINLHKRDSYHILSTKIVESQKTTIKEITLGVRFFSRDCVVDFTTSFKATMFGNLTHPRSSKIKYTLKPICTLTNSGYQQDITILSTRNLPMGFTEDDFLEIAQNYSGVIHSQCLHIAEKINEAIDPSKEDISRAYQVRNALRSIS